MLLKSHKYKKNSISRLNDFISFCNYKINSLPPSQKKLMRMYVIYAQKILSNKPISTQQINNLFAYMRYKMVDRKKCPFTKCFCLSDFPTKINPQKCLEEGPCILLC